MYPLIALGRASSFASDSLTTGQEFGRRLFVIQSNENCHVRPFQSCYLVSSNSSAYGSELFLYAEQFIISLLRVQNETGPGFDAVEFPPDMIGVLAGRSA